MIPRCFSKSVSLSMMKRFFEILPDERVLEINRRLFASLVIEKECLSIIAKPVGNTRLST